MLSFGLLEYDKTTANKYFQITVLNYYDLENKPNLRNLRYFRTCQTLRYLRYFRAYAYLTDYLASDHDCVAARLGLGRENAVGHG